MDACFKMALNFSRLDSCFSESKVSNFYEVMAEPLNSKYYVSSAAPIECIQFKLNTYSIQKL